MEVLTQRAVVFPVSAFASHLSASPRAQAEAGPPATVGDELVSPAMAGLDELRMFGVVAGDTAQLLNAPAPWAGARRSCLV